MTVITSTSAGLAILDWLRERQEQMTDLLARLVLAESPSLVPGSESAALGLLSRGARAVGLPDATASGATAPVTTSSRARSPGEGTVSIS